MLDSLGAVDDEHVIVLGKDGPELMCALLRAGVLQVTHLGSHERLEADSASLVIVPRLASLECLASALPSIRRALGPNGRVAICADPLPSTQIRVRRFLTLHGFAGLRTSRKAADRHYAPSFPGSPFVAVPDRSQA